MPQGNFIAQAVSWEAKPDVVRDGETVTVSGVDGYTVLSSLSGWSAFASNPVRGVSAGLWSVVTKDAISLSNITGLSVHTLLADGYYLSAQMRLPSNDANGKLVIKWVFNNAGTPADMPTGAGSQKFVIRLSYNSGSLR